MARNLARSTEVYASTLTKAAILAGGAAAPGNTFEVKVLDGYSYSQDTATQEIGINEAGSAPVRGTRGFNTALNPVDVSISTYVRSYLVSGPLGDSGEKILWCSALGTATGFTNSPDTPANSATFDSTTTTMTFGLATSNSNELLDLTLIFKLDNTCYVVEDFNVSTAEVDFSIDGIATINWSGFGSTLTESEAMFDEMSDWADTVDYTGQPATTSSTFIRNKLSTLVLTDNQGVKDTGDDEGAIAAGGVTLQVIDTDINITTALEYVGGRIYNTTRTQWASIVAHDTGAASTVTVSSAEVITTWVNTDVIDLFLPTNHSQIEYSIPITGATFTLENNFTYLTPEELATVNTPLAGFAGNRVTSGSFTAYLNTGATGSAGLLQDLLAKSTEVSNEYTLTFQMGGTTSSNPRVYFNIPYAQISIPTTAVEDVLSTEITFTAQPWDTANDVANFEGTNEMTIVYTPAV